MGAGRAGGTWGTGPVGCTPPWCRAASEGPDDTGVPADLQDGAASKGRLEGLSPNATTMT